MTTPAPVPATWADTDVGSPAKAGATTVAASGTVTVSGGGADIWNPTDQFHLASQTLVGNGTVIAQVAAQTNTNGWAKAGVMIRESAAADGRFVLLALTPSNGVTLQARTATHATPTLSVSVAAKAGVWLQLARVGSTFTGSVSTDGVTWKTVGTVTIPMVNNPLAGLAVTAHDNTKLSTATFNNVSVTPAAAAASAWASAATAPLARWESQTFSYGGKLYVFGGFTDRVLDATGECDVYDPAANTWTDLTTIPVVGGLTHAATTVVGDTAYFAGGTVGTFTNHQNSPGVATLLTYNLTTNTWGTTTPLPVGGSCAGLVGIANHLYYFGGLDPTNTKDVSATWGLDLANPAAGWVAEAAMPNGRNHLGAAVINGVAYAVGGCHVYDMVHGNVAEVDAYDPVANAWTQVASLPMPWSSNETSTMVVNTKIVLVGGQTNGGYDGIYLSAVEAYDPTVNAWQQVATLPEANEGQSAAYVNGQLVVAGGTVDNQGGWAQSATLVSAVAI